MKPVAYLVILSALLSAGCATSPVETDGAETPATSAPAAVAAGTADSYVLHAGDTVGLQVYGEPDISGEYRLSAAGGIGHPLLGPISLEGLTVTEAQERIRDLLEKEYLVDPRIALTVTVSSLRRVMVFGEVERPGMYDFPLNRQFTLLQAIAKAGGFTDLASIDRVRIVREVAGEKKTIKVRVSRLLRGRRRGEDVKLRPNDVITVPQTVF